MTGSDLIEKWIDQQLKDGKTPEQLHNTKFVYGNSVYTLKKRGKKFGLDITVGVIDLNASELGHSLCPYKTF